MIKKLLIICVVLSMALFSSAQTFKITTYYYTKKSVAQVNYTIDEGYTNKTFLHNLSDNTFTIIDGENKILYQLILLETSDSDNWMYFSGFSTTNTKKFFICIAKYIPTIGISSDSDPNTIIFYDIYDEEKIN